MASYALLKTPVLPSASTPNTMAPITWSLDVQAGPLDFWDPLVTTQGFVIPAGVTQVEVFCSLSAEFSTDNVDCRLEIKRNTTTIAWQIKDDHQRHQFNLSTGVISVAPGDTIRLEWETYTTGTQAENSLLLSRFGICTVDRLDFTTAIINSAHTVSTTLADVPFTAEYDPLGCLISSTEFEAPDGAIAAIVSFGIRSTTFGPTGYFTSRLLKNGTQVAIYNQRPDRWFGVGPTFGIIPVVPGDILKIQCSVPSGGARAVDTARGRRASIEWLY